MFARTFAVKAKNLNLNSPHAVVAFIEKTLAAELRGKRPFKFRLFADASAKHKKLVFHDMGSNEQVIEFSGIFGRLPQYSLECDGKTLRIYHFDESESAASVLRLLEKDGVIADVVKDEEATRSEYADVRAVTSSTSGFLDVARDLTGTVTCQVVEAVPPEGVDKSKFVPEKLPFFTVKLDAKSGPNRAIIRSCEDMHFAWSEEGSTMALLCRFKMLPPFALTLPIMGRYIQESMTLYMRSRKAVGMAMYQDDVSDSFKIEKGKPTFE